MSFDTGSLIEEIELVIFFLVNNFIFYFFRVANFLNFFMFTVEVFLLSVCWVFLGYKESLRKKFRVFRLWNCGIR